MKIESAKKNGLRIGQFINSAVSEYLYEAKRECGDVEVACCLFYLSDEELNKILTRFGNILNAKSSIGFNGAKNDK